MKKAVALLAVFVLLWGAAMPAEAWARGGWGHHRCCGWGWFWPGAVVGGLIAGAAVAATAPFAYAAAPPVVYSPPPVVVQSAPTYAAPPPATYAAPTAYAAPPVQREVVYPHGKYVLYGDGVSQPWQWVWVAAPPSSPPPPPPR